MRALNVQIPKPIDGENLKMNLVCGGDRSRKRDFFPRLPIGNARNEQFPRTHCGQYIWSSPLDEQPENFFSNLPHTTGWNAFRSLPVTECQIAGERKKTKNSIIQIRWIFARPSRILMHPVRVCAHPGEHANTWKRREKKLFIITLPHGDLCSLASITFGWRSSLVILGGHRHRPAHRKSKKSGQHSGKYHYNL